MESSTRRFTPRAFEIDNRQRRAALRPHRRWERASTTAKSASVPSTTAIFLPESLPPLKVVRIDFGVTAPGPSARANVRSTRRSRSSAGISFSVPRCLRPEPLPRTDRPWTRTAPAQSRGQVLPRPHTTPDNPVRGRQILRDCGTEPAHLRDLLPQILVVACAPSKTFRTVLVVPFLGEEFARLLAQHLLVIGEVEIHRPTLA